MTMREISHEPGCLWVTTSVVDAEAIDHERIIADIPVSNDHVIVRVAQRIDFDLLASPVATKVSRPRISCGEMFETDSAQARQIAQSLIEAANFADEIDLGVSSQLREAS